MNTKDIIEGFRKALVDVLVPEIKELSKKIDDNSQMIRKETDAKINQLREEMNRRFDKIDERFERIDERFERIDERFERIDERFERIEQRFIKIDEKFDRMEERFREHDKKFEELLNAFYSLKTDVGSIRQRDEMLHWLAERMSKLETTVEKIQEKLNRIA